ncbi:hypothetical protein CXF86_12355 [Shewanella sp. GutCb]|nr:hypothetical protein CXF86_12355 [Shewanella sp. GutCb]
MPVSELPERSQFKAHSCNNGCSLIKLRNEKSGFAQALPLGGFKSDLNRVTELDNKPAIALRPKPCLSHF